ncbi:MAG: type II toxin-antitoxin system VapC family toxin [Phycisphaerae bacterium]
MPKSILVDTDVMIDYLRGNEKAVSFLKRHADHIVLSSITVAELYAGVQGEAEQELLDAVIALFRIIPVTVESAKIGGLLKQTFGKSHGVGLADAIIAATIQIENTELGTLNTKHYPMLAGLKPAYSKK